MCGCVRQGDDVHTDQENGVGYIETETCGHVR